MSSSGRRPLLSSSRMSMSSMDQALPHVIDSHRSQEIWRKKCFQVPWHQHRPEKYVAWMREKINSWYNTAGSYQTYVYCTRSKTQKKRNTKAKEDPNSHPSGGSNQYNLIQSGKSKAHYFFPPNLGAFFSGGGGASFCPKALIKSSKLSSSSCSSLA